MPIDKIEPLDGFPPRSSFKRSLPTPVSVHFLHVDQAAAFNWAQFHGKSPVTPTAATRKAASAASSPSKACSAAARTRKSQLSFSSHTYGSQWSLPARSSVQ